MISATILSDSLNEFGNRLTTLKIVMPRYILAEFNTHRMISKNSASSRAIPFKRMIESVNNKPFVPYAWQKDHPGMQGVEYLDKEKSFAASVYWLDGRDAATRWAQLVNGLAGATKQLANRMIEPYMWHTVICTATEWENFFSLRCPQFVMEYKHNGAAISENVYRSRKDLMREEDVKDVGIIDWKKMNKGQADIHIMELAECIWDAMNESDPIKVAEYDWHLPYGDIENIDGIIYHHESYLGKSVSKLESFATSQRNSYKLKISTARCARISYETLGDNPKIDYEADINLHDRLLKSDPLHASPAEHQGRSMTRDEFLAYSKTYIVSEITPQLQTQIDMGWAAADTPFLLNGPNKNDFFITEFGWCRNFRGFIPYRHLLENNMSL